MRPAVAIFGCVLVLGSCTTTAFEELSSLAAKPSLPFSVLVTGGGFVVPAPPQDALGPLASTFAATPAAGEVFALQRLGRLLADTRVFAELALDGAADGERRAYAGTRPGDAGTAPDRLEGLLQRARAAGHDCILVVESVLDGPIEARGINDRWPFTIGAWLFALGSLIPDRTYESRARLRISIRDAYTGRRVFGPSSLEPGPVDLNMFERCNFWGFVQSVVVPPFFTATDPGAITRSVASLSVDRLLVSAVRRLKSAEVLDRLTAAGPATIRCEPDGPQWRITVTSREPLSAVALRVDGKAVEAAGSAGFAERLLASVTRVANRYHYEARARVPAGRLLKVLVQTEAARFGSITREMATR